jgi:hypothetical protein
MLHHCPNDQFCSTPFEQRAFMEFHKRVDSSGERLYKNTVGCIFEFEDDIERRENISAWSNSSAGKRRLYRQSGRFAAQARGTTAARDAGHAVPRHTRTSADQNAAGIQIGFHAARLINRRNGRWLEHWANFYWIFGQPRIYWCLKPRPAERNHWPRRWMEQNSPKLPARSRVTIRC